MSSRVLGINSLNIIAMSSRVLGITYQALLNSLKSCKIVMVTNLCNNNVLHSPLNSHKYCPSNISSNSTYAPANSHTFREF